MVKMQKNQFTFALMLCLVLTACVDFDQKHRLIPQTVAYHVYLKNL